MIKLFIFNSILILIIVALLVLFKKIIKTDKSKAIVLFIVSILTIGCHYSSLLYHHILDNTAFDYLKSNPNLILPIYPCNVVMWCCLILGLTKKKESKFGLFLCDFIFWFGLISSLVGMFFNVEFFRDPRLLNYDVTKGIVAHAIMLMNVLLLPVFGLVKIKLERNMINILISVLLMYVIGKYCNLVVEIFASKEYAYQVNSMFILHSPFDGVSFLRYPLISVIAIIIYFIIFMICELFAYKKGDRWYSRLK